MKISKSKSFRDEYCATCVTIGEIHPIEGKDRIVKTFVNGMSIVIGKEDFKQGDVAIYCANETVIHELFLHLNSMFENSALNVDTSRKGYINKHGRLRVIKLGGVPSYGLLLTPQSFATFLNEPEEEIVSYLNAHIGEDFDEVNEERFIQVYVPPVKTESVHKSKEERLQDKLNRFKMLIDGSFRFHYDTESLAKHITDIQPFDKVYISVKVHGTSFICSNIITNIPTLWYKRLWRKYIKRINEYNQKYNLVYSSRTVIKNAYINKKQKPGGYYSDDVWGY